MNSAGPITPAHIGPTAVTPSALRTRPWWQTGCLRVEVSGSGQRCPDGRTGKRA